MKVRLASIAPLLLLGAGLQAQIQLYTASEATGTNGVVMSGFSTALSDGTAHFDTYGAGNASGSPPALSKAYAGEVATIRHRDDANGALTGVYRNFNMANQPTPEGQNRGPDSAFGVGSTRDMFEWTFDPPVGHFGSHFWDLETVAGDGATVRVFNDAGAMIFESDIELPNGEDGDNAINFVGLTSSLANISIVTVSVGNTAAQVAAGNPNAENGHWIACLDLYYGQAVRRTDPLSATMWTYNQFTATFESNVQTLAAGTQLDQGAALVASGISGPSWAQGIYGQQQPGDGSIMCSIDQNMSLSSPSSTPVSVGPNEILWVLQAPHRTAGTLSLSSSWLNSVASIDIDNDGTVEWSTANGAPWSTELVIENTQLIRIEIDSTGSYPISGHNLVLTFDPNELAYDNGPIVTNLGEAAGGADASVLNPATHIWFGHSADANQNHWIADDFTVCDPQGWEVVELEFQAYEIGTGPTSTIDGLYVEFYNGDPTNGGVPLGFGPTPNTNLLASGPIANDPTNVYRVADSTITNTDRQIIDVHVKLPAPMFLSPGTYWVRWGFTGTNPNGIWVPPVTVAGKVRTGNALLFANGAWSPVPASTPGSARQGMPFRLHTSDPVETGSFTETSPGCNSSNLDVEGSPTIGGFLHAEIENATAGTIGLIGIGVTPSAIPLCGCIVGHDYTVVLVGSTFELDVPTQPSLCGTDLYLQGVEVLTGNCPILPVEYTQTVRASIR